MNQKEDINFDELFEDNKQEKDFIKKSTHFSKKRSITALLVYLLVSLLGGLVVGVLFITMKPDAIVERNQFQEMAYQIDKNIYSIGYMNRTDFDNLEASYKNEVRIIFESNGYIFIVNKDNKFLKSGDTYLLEEVLNLYIDENTKWSNETTNQSITRFNYQSNDGFDTVFDPIFETRDGYQTITNTRGFTPEAAATLQFLVYVILMVSIVPLFFNQLIVEWKENKQGISSWVPVILIGYFYMIAGNIVGNAISGVFASILNYEITTSLNQAAIEEMMLSSSGILMIIPVVLFAPIVEELVFRKAIFSLFKNEYTALIISSLLFGLIHVSSEVSFAAFIVNGITYVTSGVALGYVYIKNKHNIWASIMVHAFSNAVSVVMIFLLAV